MRILAISHLFPHQKEPRYGIFAARQLEEMHKQGADITVIVPRVWCPGVLRTFNRWKKYDHESPLCTFEGLETFKVPVFWLPGNFYNRWSGLATFLALKEKALELHKNKAFDMIYATGFFPDGEAASRLARFLKVPAACLSIGVDVNITAHSSRRIYRHFVRTAKALDGLLACGQSVADVLKNVSGKNPLCVYGVLDTEIFKPIHDKIPLKKQLGLPLDKTIVIYAGYLLKSKGVYELVEAIERVRKQIPRIMLIMCGAGPEEDGLMKIIREKHLEQTVRLLGEIDPDHMCKWMQASDLFVLASYTEGMPNAVMEAMACGVPVVTTTVGGLPSAIGDCTGAILVPPRNVPLLVNAIYQILSDDQLMRTMQISARKKAEIRFSGSRNAQLILDYFSDILETKN
ncbi:glycosyltransferase [bacterium]|nr:glycosyltransferase [bacterium]